MDAKAPALNRAVQVGEVSSASGSSDGGTITPMLQFPCPWVHIGSENKDLRTTGTLSIGLWAQSRNRLIRLCPVCATASAPQSETGRSFEQKPKAAAMVWQPALNPL